jgi:hypothetical protein
VPAQTGATSAGVDRGTGTGTSAKTDGVEAREVAGVGVRWPEQA